MYLVTDPNILEVFSSDFQFLFSFTTKIEMEILIFDFSNVSGAFNIHSMIRRFRVRGILIVILIDL